jgi:hypothetical protein
VAKAKAVVAKISSNQNQSTSSKQNSNAQVRIDNLKPGQRIRVTVNKK